jgi:hypothetical protein
MVVATEIVAYHTVFSMSQKHSHIEWPGLKIANHLGWQKARLNCGGCRLGITLGWLSFGLGTLPAVMGVGIMTSVLTRLSRMQRFKQVVGLFMIAWHCWPPCLG